MKDNKSISLFIDTATKALCVGAMYDGKKAKSPIMDSKKALEYTNLAIENLGKELGFQLKDVDSFYCLLGPGSNTGIRLGLTIPKTIFAFNPKIRLFGIETLKLFLADKPTSLAALSDRGGNLFLGSIVDGEYSYRKVEKEDIESIPHDRNIRIEKGDSMAKEELAGFDIEEIDVIDQMMENSASFEDYSDRDDEFLPIYSQAI